MATCSSSASTRLKIRFREYANDALCDPGKFSFFRDDLACLIAQGTPDGLHYRNGKSEVPPSLSHLFDRRTQSWMTKPVVESMLFYKNAYQKYARRYREQLIQILRSVDARLAPQRTELGEVRDKQRVLGTWRWFVGSPSAPLPFMHFNALRGVPTTRIEVYLKQQMRERRPVLELGKFAVDPDLPPETRDRTLRLIELNWIEMVQTAPNGLIVAHVLSGAAARHFSSRYGFTIAEKI